MHVQRRFFALTLVIAVAVTSPAKRILAQTADELISDAIAAMGGEERIQSLSSMSWTGMEHHNWLEQSERPDGPWLTSYYEIEELRDLRQMRARRKGRSRSLIAGGQWNEMTLIHDKGVTAGERGGRMGPLPPSLTTYWIDQIRLAPERVLFTAKNADDLTYRGSTMLQDVEHRVIGFTLDGFPASIFFNAHTDLPTAVEIVHPAFVDLWGDIPHRIYYSFWYLEENGLRYPRQIDMEIDGVPYRRTTIMNLEFDVPAPADTFSVSDQVRQMAQQMNKRADFRSMQLGRPDREATEIESGIVEIPGRWDVVIVRQDDGLVILEAPVASEYSAQVIEEAGKRFPDTPIKAVVTTSDAWPHLAGVREYVARGIRVFAHRLNRPILERLINSPYESRPDALQLNRSEPNFTWIDGHVQIGSGANRIDVYPMRGEGSERMLMAWFPEHHLLYASDMIQKYPDGRYFMPQYPSEVIDAARRNDLEPERVFAMHLGVTPWSEILTVIRKLRPGY